MKGARAERAIKEAKLGIKNRDKEKDFERRGKFGAFSYGCPAN